MGSSAEIVSAVFRALDRQGVRAVVPRNYERLPDEVVGDLDLLVHPADADQAVEAVLAASAECGWRVFQRLNDWNHEHLILWGGSSEHDPRVLHLDLQRSLGRKGFHYCRVEPFLGEPERHGGIPVARPAARATALALHALLDKGRVDARYREAMSRDAGPGLEEFARRALAIPSAGAMIAWLRAGAPQTDLAQLALQLRGELKRRHPSNVIRPAAVRLRRWLRLAGPRRGVLVAALGPNGAGKTTTLEAVVRRFPPGPYPVRIAYMGKRETFLPTSRLIRRFYNRGSTDGRPVRCPEREEMRRAGTLDRVKDVLGLVNWALEQWSRYWVDVRPYLQQDGIVLVDRYSFDISGRPPWSLVHHPRFTALFCRLFPRPDRTYLFWEEPETLVARKQEDTLEQAAANLEQLRNIVRKVPGSVEIRTNVPVGAIADRVAEEIVDLMGAGHSR